MQKTRVLPDAECSRVFLFDSFSCCYYMCRIRPICLLSAYFPEKQNAQKKSRNTDSRQAAGCRYTREEEGIFQYSILLYTIFSALSIHEFHILTDIWSFFMISPKNAVIFFKVPQRRLSSWFSAYRHRGFQPCNPAQESRLR